MKFNTPSPATRYEDFRADYFRHHAFIPKTNIYHVGESPTPHRRISLPMVIVESAMIGAALLLYVMGVAH